MALRTISVCTGVGMLDVGLELAFGDLRPIVYIEREIQAATRLAARIEEGSLPAAPIWSDLTTFDAGRFRGMVDLICGGLPCQPFSVAGRRRGENDERYIWNDFSRIVEECRPTLVALENVPGILQFFEPIGERLSGLGYRFEAGIWSAAEVGASHRRERFFCLGFLGNSKQQRRSQPERGELSEVDQKAARRMDSGRDRQRQAASWVGESERFLGHPKGGGFRILWEPPRSERQPDGADDDVADACSERRSKDAGSTSGYEETDGGPRRHRIEPNGDHEFECQGAGVEEAARNGRHRCEGGVGERRGVCEAGDKLGNSRLQRSELQQRDFRTEPSSASDGIFAPGPADPRWPAILESSPWLAPALATAEIESSFRGVADGMAAVLGNERTAALRCIGNGVVPATAFKAFRELRRRLGI